MRNLIVLMVIGIVSGSAALADTPAAPAAKKPGIFTTFKEKVKAMPGGVKKGFEGFKNKFKKKPDPVPAK